jgi:hypothetical protein
MAAPQRWVPFAVSAARGSARAGRSCPLLKGNPPQTPTPAAMAGGWRLPKVPRSGCVETGQLPSCSRYRGLPGLHSIAGVSAAQRPWPTARKALGMPSPACQAKRSFQEVPGESSGQRVRPACAGVGRRVPGAGGAVPGGAALPGRSWLPGVRRRSAPRRRPSHRDAHAPGSRRAATADACRPDEPPAAAPRSGSTQRAARRRPSAPGGGQVPAARGSPVPVRPSRSALSAERIFAVSPAASSCPYWRASHAKP